MGSEKPEVHVELAAVPGAAQRARALVERVAAGLPGDVGFRARLVAGELVANSVQHAAAAYSDRVGLTVLRSASGVRVEVRDRGAPFDDAPRFVPERATSGRGLRLVDALADRWGAEHEDGNLVWFEIDAPSRRDHDPRSTQPAGRSVGRSERESLPGRPEEGVVAAALLARAAGRVRIGWCQGADGRDESGDAVEPWSGRAASWSLRGSLVAAPDGPPAVGEVPLPALATGMAALAEVIEDRSLGGWNDSPTRTQREVIAVLERAGMLVADPGLSETASKYRPSPALNGHHRR
jgi:anti-sigma regulatory factor (Ser/Thr protein kinase)